MNNKEWQALEKQEYEFLEYLKIPITFFKNKYVNEVMNCIEDLFNDKYKEWQKIEDPYIFNLIDTSDFIDWVTKTYGIKFYEEIKYRFQGWSGVI